MFRTLRQPATWHGTIRPLKPHALAAAALAALTTLTATAPVRAQANQTARPLYTLQTDCAVAGEVGRCTVEAFDGNRATLYRTTVKGRRISFRLVDQSDLRGAQLWNPKQNAWVGLDRLSLDFATNTLCINGEELCIHNPNYFASLREEYPTLRSDLIKARFTAKEGRLAAICYTREACDAGF